MNPIRTSLAIAAGAAVALGALAAPAGATDDGSALEVEVALDGRSLDDGAAPFELDPAEEVLIDLTVTNTGDDDVVVHKVRLAGDTLGLTFFAFTAPLDLRVGGGDTESLAFRLDVSDLDGQANGLLDGSIQLLDDGNDVVASAPFTADALGSLTSTSALFGLAVALLTAFLLVGVVLGLRRATLPTNRFSRAIRFAEPGAGLGLAMTFTLSTLRIVLVPPSVGLALVAIGAVVGFGVGYTLARSDDAVELDLRDPVAPRRPTWPAVAVAGHEVVG